MATIRKRGDTYQIRVSCGYDVSGKRLEKSVTWTPPYGMTAAQIKKELERQKVLFEEKVKNGLFLDGNITFAEFTDQWLKDYAEKQLKEYTVHKYLERMPRIIAAIGHIRLCKLQPHHLMEFYNNLSEKGVRGDITYKAQKDIKELYTAKGYNRGTFAAAANLSAPTVSACCNGKAVSKQTADKVTAVLGGKKLFKAVDNDKRLSNTTIAEYHGLIASVLSTAVQWQVIPSNPCQRVQPPKTEKKEPVILDEKQTAELIQCLDSEPLKYKTAIMFLLYSGMRRGELCGLNWSDIDFKSGMVSINKAVQYASGKGVYETTTKTKQSVRAIQIPPSMLMLLKQYRAEQNTKRLMLGDKWKNSGKVFTDTYGGLFNPSVLASWFSKFIKRQGLPDIHLHSLRHPYVKLKLKFLLTQHYRCISAKVLDFPLNFKPVVGVNIHFVYEHICECLCQGVFLFHCFCCLQSF